MKKLLALFLALCMMAAVLPVLAESAEEEAPSGLDSMFEEILSSEGTVEEKTSSILEKLSGLKDQFSGSASQFAAFLSSLGEKVKEWIRPGEEAIGDLFSSLKEKLGSFDLKSLFGGGEEGGFSLSGLLEGLHLDSVLGGLFGAPVEEGEDGETFEQTVERLNREAEAETGKSVPGRKPAESVEEFYGSWIETKFVFYGEEIGFGDDSEEGVFIAENTYYITMNGEKSSDYLYPENAELTLRDGTLKVNADGHWYTLVLTEDGELVDVSSNLLTYFKRVEE